MQSKTRILSFIGFLKLQGQETPKKEIQISRPLQYLHGPISKRSLIRRMGKSGRSWSAAQVPLIGDL